MLTRQHSLVKLPILFCVTALLVFLTACVALPQSQLQTQSQTQPQQLNVTVVDTVALPPDTFTQGLEVDVNGNLLIGTGLNGSSRLLRLKPSELLPTQEIALQDSYFGEGVTQTDAGIWQIGRAHV